MAERRFTSAHHCWGRVYRVTDPGDATRLARVEHLRGDLWRPSQHIVTRELGHYLVHGETHDPAQAKSIATLAAKARRLNLWPDCAERAGEEVNHG